MRVARLSVSPTRRWLTSCTAAALAAAGLVCSTPAQAGASQVSGWCDRPAQVTATEQDRLLRVAAVIRQTLDRAGRSAALISRSGLDLGRFGLRYSHAGISLRGNPNGSWSVRQLYYACDESRPRVFDQGLTGFLLGTDNPRSGFISLVLLPQAPDALLARAALDRPRALALLADAYSANAHVFSTRYQNCNQWVMELIATAWGLPEQARPSRQQAQAWLRSQGYRPEPVEVGSHALMFAAHFVPLLQVDDHPLDDLQALRMHTTLPRSIEAFVREQVPQAERIELCHNTRRIVVRHGWVPMADGCEPAPGDEVIEFDA